MKHADFTLYLKKGKTGMMWYAKYWNHETKCFNVYRSLKVKAAGKRQRRTIAYHAAQELLKEIDVHNDTCSFAGFLEKFWAKDGIYSVEFGMMKEKTLAVSYLLANESIVKNSIAQYPQFNTLSSKDITGGIIHDYMLWENNRGTNNGKLNKILKVMRVALHYLYYSEKIDIDPFVRIKNFKEKSKEKGVLTKAESELILANMSIPISEKCGILLGLTCGLRMGEVRGLQWADIDMEENKINIVHNWQNKEGVKAPKSDSTRFVFIMPVIRDLLRKIDKKSTFVFPRNTDYTLPVTEKSLTAALKKVLANSGISTEEQKKRNLTFHSLRHSFITNGRVAGISDVEIMALAGHKTTAMMDRYSHVTQIINLAALNEKMSSYYAAAKQQ